MPLGQVNASSNFIRRMLGTGIFSEQAIYALDVGASGGVEGYLLSLDPFLMVDAFDPLVAEIARLRKSAPPYIHYWPYFIDSGIIAEQDLVGNETSFFSLSSASKLMELTNLNYVEERFNSGSPVVVSDECISLDAFLRREKRPSPNFLKIDTDGHDLEVLLGATTTLADPGLVAVQIECQFNGPPSSATNTFSNIDTTLRKAGFSLIVLEPWVYSRAALPAPFLYDIPAQTTRGSIGFADALYLRDPVVTPDFWDSYEESDTTFAALLVLAVLHGCDDVAANVIVDARDRGIHAHLPYHDLLNDLVPGNPWKTRTYEEFISMFHREPTGFLATQWRSSSVPTSGPKTQLARLVRHLRNVL